MISGARPMARRRAHTTGVKAWVRESERVTEKLMRATEHAVNDGLHIIERAEKRELSRRSHPLGTSTNSPPGNPPSLITGHMRRSWRTHAASRTARYKVAGWGGNTTVQARIQELGGRTGAGHRTYLPPRPYLGPAVRAKRDEVFEGFRRRYTEVILMTSA
jgi:hypothetical protein